MKRIVPLVLLLSFAVPTFASTHKDVFNVSCNELWRAVKDTLRNSGKYGIIAIDNTEMTASYNMGGNLMAKRTNSAVLNSKDNGASCELQIQTAYSGLGTNDAGDFKKRVDESLAKLKSQPLPSPQRSRPVQRRCRSGSGFHFHRLHSFRRGYRDRRRFCRRHPFGYELSYRLSSGCGQEKGLRQLDQNSQCHQRHRPPERGSAPATASAIAAAAVLPRPFRRGRKC